MTSVSRRCALWAARGQALGVVWALRLVKEGLIGVTVEVVTFFSPMTYHGMVYSDETRLAGVVLAKH